MEKAYYLYTEGLSVGYHGVPLIRNIELCLKKGTILTLIGPNGAGKTTILKSLIRQLEPLGGAVFLDMRYKLEFLSIIQNLSVIMSLHELDLAGRISDKIACVRGGQRESFLQD